MGRQLLSKRFPACATYWGRISIGMPTKPSLFGRPDDLLEKHSEQINTVGIYR